MQAVLMSIKPYWVFLIIAKTMGWNIDKEKTVEVRKNYPKDESWDKVVKLYCSKDKKSFAKIPKEYQPLMQQFLGKVIGEFVCDKVYQYTTYNFREGVDISDEDMQKMSCMTFEELSKYEHSAANDFCLSYYGLFGWHISDLVIYDKPKELDYFRKPIDCHRGNDRENCKGCWDCEIKRPPQSWCYVEEMG